MRVFVILSLHTMVDESSLQFLRQKLDDFLENRRLETAAWKPWYSPCPKKNQMNGSPA